MLYKCIYNTLDIHEVVFFLIYKSNHNLCLPCKTNRIPIYVWRDYGTVEPDLNLEPSGYVSLIICYVTITGEGMQI
jgi:hypothetical protein